MINLLLKKVLEALKKRIATQISNNSKYIVNALNTSMMFTIMMAKTFRAISQIITYQLMYIQQPSQKLNKSTQNKKKE